MIPEDVAEYARKIWDYSHMHHALTKADCIIALGSRDTHVAERAADLYLQGFAPRIVFSGCRGVYTAGWEKTEAETFSAIAIERGVPKDVILKEEKSTNTGENFIFTKKLLTEHGIVPKTAIIVQKPYMERRAYATVKKVWPELEVVVTSPQCTFDSYIANDESADVVINVMVGDIQRIQEYPARGFQIPQEIPPDVWAAYEKLVALGYSKHLIQ